MNDTSRESTRTDGNRTENSRSLFRVGKLGTLGVTIALLVGFSLAGTVTAQSSPELQMDDAEVGVDYVQEIDVVLTEAPDGLSGFEFTLTVEDSSVAEIRAVEYNPHLEITRNETEPGNETRAIRAGDLTKKMEPGDSNLTLARIGVEGVSTGETTLEISDVQFDADGGDQIDLSLNTSTVTVTNSSAGVAPADEYTPTEIDVGGGGLLPPSIGFGPTVLAPFLGLLTLLGLGARVVR